jgi:hypothetical protein
MSGGPLFFKRTARARSYGDANRVRGLNRKAHSRLSTGSRQNAGKYTRFSTAPYHPLRCKRMVIVSLQTRYLARSGKERHPTRKGGVGWIGISDQG